MTTSASLEAGTAPNTGVAAAAALPAKNARRLNRFMVEKSLSLAGTLPDRVRLNQRSAAKRTIFTRDRPSPR
jgi:hypothetical protein